MKTFQAASAVLANRDRLGARPERIPPKNFNYVRLWNDEGGMPCEDEFWE